MPRRRKKPKTIKLAAPKTRYQPDDAARLLIKLGKARGITDEDLRLTITNPATGQPIALSVFKTAFRAELRAGHVEAETSMIGFIFGSAKKGNAGSQSLYIKNISYLRDRPDAARHLQLTADGTTPSGDPTTTLSLEQLVELRGEVARLVAEVTGQSARRGDVEAQMDPDSEDQAANP